MELARSCASVGLRFQGGEDTAAIVPYGVLASSWSQGQRCTNVLPQHEHSTALVSHGDADLLAWHAAACYMNQSTCCQTKHDTV